MHRKFTCIICPNGCEIEALIDNNTVKSIEGAMCKRGIEYVNQEIIDPRRNIASSILVVGGEIPLVSVRLSSTISKNDIFKVMDEIKNSKVSAPVRIGQILIKDVVGSGVDVIATKNVDEIKSV